MAPCDDNALATFKLNNNNDWLRQRQGVALPIVPPNTPEARKYFFSKIGAFVVDASANGKRKINYENFAKEWNRSADGKHRFYVTPEVLSAYAKTWDKTNNARASQELIAAKLDLVNQTGELFQVSTAPFPDSLTGVACTVHPQRGVMEFTDSDSQSTIPGSIAVELSVSHPHITPNQPSAPTQRAIHKQPSTNTPTMQALRPGSAIPSSRSLHSGSQAEILQSSPGPSVDAVRDGDTNSRISAPPDDTRG